MSAHTSPRPTPPLPLRTAARLWAAGATGHALWAIGALAVGLGDADPPLVTVGVLMLATALTTLRLARRLRAASSTARTGLTVVGGLGALLHGSWLLLLTSHDQTSEPATEAVCAALLVLIAVATALPFLPAASRWLRSAPPNERGAVADGTPPGRAPLRPACAPAPGR